MNANNINQLIENSEEVVGTVLTRVTVDRIFDLFTIHRRSVREICKALGVRCEHVEYALRCKVNQLREAGLPRSAFGKPIKREVVSMPARVRGYAA